MLRICCGCGTAYAPDLEACPHCGDREFRWNHPEVPDVPAPPQSPRVPAAPPKEKTDDA
jgi:predicted  nucleic acid-binding Zn-ribbon protein